MGKRSDFERIPKEKYYTPLKAVPSLINQLEIPDNGLNYIEICGGNGALIDHLSSYNLNCIDSYDIEPERNDIKFGDASKLDFDQLYPNVEYLITNPPWRRDMLHPILSNIIDSDKKCWFLIDLNWAATKQASPYLTYCKKIVVIGRLNWIPGTTMASKDDCAWYLFGNETNQDTIFVNNR